MKTSKRLIYIISAMFFAVGIIIAGVFATAQATFTIQTGTYFNVGSSGDVDVTVNISGTNAGNSITINPSTKQLTSENASETLTIPAQTFQGSSQGQAIVFNFEFTNNSTDNVYISIQEESDTSSIDYTYTYTISDQTFSSSNFILSENETGTISITCELLSESENVNEDLSLNFTLESTTNSRSSGGGSSGPTQTSITSTNGTMTLSSWLSNYSVGDTYYKASAALILTLTETGSTISIDDITVDYEGVAFTTSGTQNITITYNDDTLIYFVTVTSSSGPSGPTQTSLMSTNGTMTLNSWQSTYTVGDTYYKASAGLNLILNASGTIISTDDITVDCEGVVFSTVGTQNITITYNDDTLTYSVTVSTSISTETGLVVQPNANTYYVNQEIPTSDFVVTYNGVTVTDFDITVDNTTAGMKTVTIGYTPAGSATRYETMTSITILEAVVTTNAYLRKDWISALEEAISSSPLTMEDIYQDTISILVISETEYTQQTYSVLGECSVGALSQGSYESEIWTQEDYSTNLQNIEDVTLKLIQAPNDSEKYCLVFYSSGTIYAPTDSSYLFSSSTSSDQFASIVSLDLSNLDLSGCTDVSNMIDGMTSLEEMDIPSLSTYTQELTIDLPTGITLYDEYANSYTQLIYTTTQESVYLVDEITDSYLSKDWVDLIYTAISGSAEMTRAELVQSVKSISFINDETELPENYLSTTVSVGATSEGVLNDSTFTQTKLTTAVEGVSDVTVYIEAVSEGENNYFNLYFYTDALKIYAPVDSSNLFYDYNDGSATSFSSLEEIDFGCFNTSSVTSMGYMFGGCSSLTTLDLSSFDTSSVTNMSYMFYNCSSLTSVILSTLDTSSVTIMQDMFAGCSNLTEIYLNSLSTTSVINMDSMFAGCSSLSSLDLSGFDLSSCTNTTDMLTGMTNLTTLKTPTAPNKSGSITIQLYKTMYAVDSSEGVSSIIIDLSSTSYTLKSTTWTESPSTPTLSATVSSSANSFVTGYTLQETDFTVTLDGVSVTTGYMMSPAMLMTAGNQTVTITYQAYTTTVEITVTESTPSTPTLSAVVSSTANSFVTGYTLQETDFTVTLDDVSVTTGYTMTPAMLMTAGNQTVTITYQTYTTTVEITVTESTPSTPTLSAVASSTANSFVTGYTLQETDFTVTLDDEEVSGFTMSPATLTTAGTQTVMISYQTYMTTVDITVTENQEEDPDEPSVTYSYLHKDWATKIATYMLEINENYVPDVLFPTVVAIYTTTDNTVLPTSDYFTVSVGALSAGTYEDETWTQADYDIQSANGIADVIAYLTEDENDNYIIYLYTAGDVILAPSDSSYLFSNSNTSYQLTGLTTLDLSSMDMSYVDDTSNMLTGMTSLVTLETPTAQGIDDEDSITIAFPNNITMYVANSPVGMTSGTITNSMTSLTLKSAEWTEENGE